MKADPSAQLKLLDVQALDARADQLRHQRQTLPEIAKISELTTHHTTVLSQLRDQQIVVDDLTAAQTKADADVEQVKARRARDQQRMDLGQITNPKDLEHMQHELETLQRRITVLEDEELEVMEQLEIAATGLDVLRQEVTDAETTMAELMAERDRRAVEIDASLAEIVAQREPAVEGLPEDLLALYERLRGSKNGVGAAELRARECTGCRLSIDSAELDLIRTTSSDTVVRCEECQRILVRTSESGL